jgi:hypothetical protein
MHKFKLYPFYQILLALLGISVPCLCAQAICPVCTVIVGVGIGLSRWLGVDDSVTGLWIGAFTASLIAWTIVWLNKINIRFYGRKILITLFYYAIIILPLYYINIMGLPDNKLWGLDKLLLGIILGSLAFLISILWYNHLKRKNNGKSHFHGEKILIPTVVLMILSAIFYYLTK